MLVNLGFVVIALVYNTGVRGSSRCDMGRAVGSKYLSFGGRLTLVGARSFHSGSRLFKGGVDGGALCFPFFEVLLCLYARGGREVA